MTDNEMRIAIVTACPEVFVRPTGSAGWNYKSSITGRIMPCIDGDPLKDLGALHEVEKMPSMKTDEYNRQLQKITKRAHYNFVWHATARQRAEAFLRAIGKYVASPQP